MSEKSWPWSTAAGLGDGAAELNEALAREFLALYFGVQNPAVEGVCKGLALGELAVSGVASPLSIAPGAGICYGLYINDGVVTKAVSTPAVGTTGGRVVLQTNWAGTGGAPLEARTRIAVKVSPDGNPAIPALTQSFGTTWEVSLATFTITTGGAITVTDDRTFRRSTAMVGTAEIDNLAVTSGKLAAGAVTSGKLAAGAVTAGKIAASAVQADNLAAGAINNSAQFAAGVVNAAALGALAVETAKINDLAVTSGKLGANAVVAGKLADGAVDTTARLANDIVDDTKAGNRVPQFYRRQGGDATDWNFPGATNYTPGAVRMQAGAILCSSSGVVAVTFPVAFSAKPLVFPGNTGARVVGIYNVTATGFNVDMWNFSAGTRVAEVALWLAVGPE
jgi:hypothetical protein